MKIVSVQRVEEGANYPRGILSSFPLFSFLKRKFFAWSLKYQTNRQILKILWNNVFKKSLCKKKNWIFRLLSFPLFHFFKHWTSLKFHKKYIIIKVQWIKIIILIILTWYRNDESWCLKIEFIKEIIPVEFISFVFSFFSFYFFFLLSLSFSLFRDQLSRNSKDKFQQGLLQLKCDKSSQWHR